MSNYDTDRSSIHLGNVVVISGILAASNMAAPDNPEVLNSPSISYVSMLPGPSYLPSSTYSIISGLSNSGEDFIGCISAFYERLLVNQEPLGEEFEEILFSNLSNLYETT